MVMLCLFGGIRAQELGLSAGIGLSNQRMEDLKELQLYNMSQEFVEMEVLSSYPDYTLTSVSLYYQLYDDIRIGGGYVYSSTGARSNYTDYSGEVNLNILANSHRIGAFLAYQLVGGNWYDLSVYGRADGHISRVERTRSIYVLGVGSRSTERFTGMKAAFTAGSEFLFHFREISFGLDGGYMLDLPAPLTSSDTNSELKIPSNGTSKVVTTDWTGWRAQAKVIVWFDR
jgi:hypothetical protein